MKSTLTTYKPLVGQKPFRQIAHFLAWASKSLPKEYLDHKVIARAINGYTPGTRITVDQVMVVKNSMSRAKLCLRREHKLGYHSVPKIGARATSGSDDITEKSLRTEFGRLAAQRKTTNEVADIISPSGFRSRKNQEFYKAVKGNLLSAGDDERVKRLLPPKQEE